MKGFKKNGKFRPTGNKKKSPSRKKRQNFENAKIQSLIFNKKKFTNSTALEWASDHGFKAVKVEPTKNTLRIRQFSPNKIKRGTECKTIQFGGSGVQGVLCDTPDKFKRDRYEHIISDEEAKELRKQLHKDSISKEDYEKIVAHHKSKASDLYKIYLDKFPNSNIGRDNARWGTSGYGSHGHFGDALFEGRYEDAMFRADSSNLVNLKEIGIEHFLSKEKPHPDDESPYNVFMGRYNWAKEQRG